MKSWDGESFVSRRDAETNAWMFVALHSSRLGPSTGGTRMIPYDDLASARRDAMRLSEGMTFKWAAAGFPRGGGKGVIAAPPGLDVRGRADLLRRYGQLVKDLGGRFWTGADAGTSAADMDVIAETGAPYIFSRTEANGGAGSSAPWTALGLFASLQAVCARIFGAPSLAGRRVLVQGAGSVGRPLIERLAAAGAQVSFSDIEPEAARLPPGIAAEYVPPERLFDTPCDVFAPCALGAVLNADTIPRLRCRAIVGAANNQLAEPQDAERLRAGEILYAPDFVVNAGGAIAITGIEALGWSREKAEREVEGIAGTLSGILDLSDAEGITTETAARRIAARRLEAART